MPLIKLAKQNGFTLSEMMIALVVNSILFLALIGIFVADLEHYRKVINANRLQQQLQGVMDIMASDIRRAGYWGNASSDLDTNQNNNPFMASGIDLAISGSCILFAYDKNSDGVLPAISSAYDDERYGYRLTAQAIQARPPGAPFSCAASSSSWENLTDTKIINITNLTFGLTTKTVTTGPGTIGIIMRSIDITITGQLVSDATITKTLTQHIRIRNDKFTP